MLVRAHEWQEEVTTTAAGLEESEWCGEVDISAKLRELLRCPVTIFEEAIRVAFVEFVPILSRLIAQLVALVLGHTRRILQTLDFVLFYCGQ